MKTILIILNWLFGWVLLSYSGSDPAIAFIMVGWFGFATWLLNRNRKEVERTIKRFEKRIDKLMSKEKHFKVYGRYFVNNSIKTFDKK